MELMALPSATAFWDEARLGSLYSDCRVAMTLDDKSPIVSETYRYCLERGREVIIDKMVKLIMDQGYFKLPDDSGIPMLYWQDAPQCLAKFVQHLETVFTGYKEIKLRKKKLAPGVGVATLAAANAPLPRPSVEWDADRIKILYENCQFAMKLLENNSDIISEKYRQCLQRGRDAIIENIMKFIMDTRYFKKHRLLTEYTLCWDDASAGFTSFLQHLEAVFIGYEEVKIRRKRITPAAADLVALVEEPDPRQKSGILKTYGEMKFFAVDFKVQLEFLQGKRLLDEKWAEEDETYDLSGETNAILCMHLWSLMRLYAGFSNPDQIWEVIGKGWPECVSWKNGCYGQFWQIIHSDQVSLRVQAETKGLKGMLDAYKDMESYFKRDEQHFLKNWQTAYGPEEDNPNPNLN